MPGFFDVMKEPPVAVPGDERFPLFSRISIETLSFCNRSCTFCPLHWSQDERGRKSMTDELYTKIVGELGDLKFDGVVQMFLLSEPTIDRKMYERLKSVRFYCPEASSYASSNGDVFDAIFKSRGLDAAVEKVLSYYEAGLTVLNLNVYDEGPDQAARYRELYLALLGQGVRKSTNKYRHHNPRGRFICLTDMRLERPGAASLTDVLYIKPKEVRQSIVAPAKHCARPHRHLVVEYDGNVPICCAIDVTDKALPSMGNANTSTLVSIWNGDQMNQYRWFLQQKQRVLPGCSTCTHQMAFPHVVRKVQPDDETKARWTANTPI